MPSNTTAKSSVQTAVETVRAVIEQIGPATARQIESHPDVVRVCRNTKTKARRIVERLCQMGEVNTCGSSQQPLFWV